MTRYSKINNLRTRALSSLDILSIEEVAGIIGRNKEVVKDWLYEMGIVRDVCGKQRVIYGDVLDGIRGVKTETPTEQAYMFDLGEDLV